MSGSVRTHLIERAVERMAELGTLPPAALGPVPPPFVAEDVTPPPAQRPLPPAPAPVAERPVTAPAVVMATLEAAGLAVAGTRRARVAEEWWGTSGQLLRALRTLPPRRGAGGGVMTPNLLLVTSARPGEGKTFSALNLAGSLTLGSRADVLLLDTGTQSHAKPGTKPGGLSAMLGVADRPGLLDLVADPALPPEELVLATAIPGLSILPVGRAAGAPGSADRTAARPVVGMIEHLARHFADRVVILDAASCLANGDISAFASTVDQIAMIVEAGRTRRDDLEAALELLHPCRNIILVLNKVGPAGQDAFGDAHYYDA